MILHHPKFFEGAYPCASYFNIIPVFYLYQRFPGLFDLINSLGSCAI